MTIVLGNVNFLFSVSYLSTKDGPRDVGVIAMPVIPTSRQQ